MSKLVFEKGIKVTQDLVIEILKRWFPECTVSVQKTFGISMVIVRKNCFVRVIVRLFNDKDTGGTKIGTTTGMDPLAQAFFGFIIHFIVRGNIEDEVREVLDRELRKGYSSAATVIN